MGESPIFSSAGAAGRPDLKHRPEFDLAGPKPHTEITNGVFMNFDINDIISHPWVKQLLLWLALGLGVGVAAKIIIPGSESLGWIRTIGVGLLGSFLGNYLAPRIFDWPAYDAFSLPGIGIGVAGAVILVVLNRIVTKS